jgi:hypothetical protein
LINEMRLRWTVAVIAAAGCGTTAPRATIAPAVATRVLASRREVRVVFPSEPARAWGWPPRSDSSYAAAFAWGATVDGLDGPRSLVLTVPARAIASRQFASLRDVVAAGSASICAPGMIQACKGGVAASVEGSRVVLSLRDRRLIEQLFAMRPPVMRVWRPGPGPEQLLFDSVAVEYVEPMIPEPDAALRADAAHRRRAYEASIRSIMRYIYADGAQPGPIWVAVGDSARVHMGQLDCTYDACAGTSPAFTGATWSTEDSSVAALRAQPPRRGPRAWVDPGPALYVEGRRPGRTQLHVDLPPSALDTVPSRAPPPRALAVDVVVTPRIGRFVIVPRGESAHVGDRIEFQLAVEDTTGAPLTGLPAELRVISPTDQRLGAFGSPSSVTFDRAGTWRIVARLGTHVDTVLVAVSSVAKP